MLALAVLVFALLGTIIYLVKLNRITHTAPRIELLAAPTAEKFSISVLEPPALVEGGKLAIIIPAYNEVENICDCVVSALASIDECKQTMQVWVVDDQSTDGTLATVQALQQSLADPRLQVLAGQPRPEQQTWMGKNWACTQAMLQVRAEYLLFVDADVRLKPGAIATALETMQREQIDLLTLWPAIVCGCLGEWLVQPLVASMLAAGFDFAEVNDPQIETAFAVGPFMLFRRTAYEKLGGHRAVADQVVEDVELARRTKQQGLKLKYALGHNLASVRMYRSWQGVWEGWTKNWYLGSRRNLSLTLYSAVIVILVCTCPWLGLVGLIGKGVWVGWQWVDLLAMGIALGTILLQYFLRRVIASLSAIPTRYWWLMGVGGLLVAAIAFASIIKTETGWGWTWRGRSLKLPDQSVG